MVTPNGDMYTGPRQRPTGAPVVNMPRPQSPMGMLGQGISQFAGGVGGGLLDVGRRMLSPETSPFTGQNLQPYDPWFQPQSLPGQIGRGFVSGFTGGYPEGPVDHEKLSGLEQAFYFGDLVDPSGIAGDILRPLSKAIPEGVLAGGFQGGWFKPKTQKRPGAFRPQGVPYTPVPSEFNPDYWNHLINSKPTDLTADQVRERGAYLLYMDDIEKGITNTSPETYLAMGRGTQSAAGNAAEFVPGGTRMTTLRPGEFTPYPSIEKAIERGTDSPFRENSPTLMLEQSDRFNRIAKELSGDLGEDTQWNTYDWFLEREDYLEMEWGFNPDFFGKGPKEVSGEFDRLAQEFKKDAQKAQKRLIREADRIMDEELKIMERGMGNIK